MNQQPLVVTRSASVKLGSDRILEEVSVEVFPGDRILIVGPNGGGKTTLIRLLLGLLDPKVGQVFWARSRPRLGYLPQTPNIDRNFPLRVEEVVRHGFLGTRPPWERSSLSEEQAVREVLAEFQLTALARAYLDELSGGQLRRVLLARALVSNPSVLVLDEPTASLDQESRKRLWRRIERLPPEATVLLVTHDLEPQSFRANRAWVVDGRVRELAPSGWQAVSGWCGHQQEAER
jgi:zinc transport system ATP-binding protein